MRWQLTSSEIESYRTNGFVVIDDFLNAEELETWRKAVDDAVLQRGNVRLDRGDLATTESYYDQVFIQRVNLWKNSPAVKQLIQDWRIGKMTCDLEGVDAMRIWHDQALIKEPWANPTSWHLDVPYWSFDSRHAISIWIALDDATLQNGCLYFLPGTHRSATFDNVGIGPNMREIFKVYPQWKKLQSVAAPMKAGSCSFHNGLTAHGAGANMTPGFRRAMTCGFMPDGSTFNGKQNILTQEQMARLQVGDVHRDDAQNPIIYSRSMQYPEPAAARA